MSLAVGKIQRESSDEENLHFRRKGKSEDEKHKRDYAKPSICCKNLTSNKHFEFIIPHYSAAFRQ